MGIDREVRTLTPSLYSLPLACLLCGVWLSSRPPEPGFVGESLVPGTVLRRDGPTRRDVPSTLLSRRWSVLVTLKRAGLEAGR